MTTDTGFKPVAMEPADEDYMGVDDLHRIYGEAWNEGLWLKEFGGAPNGSFMAACGSVYKLQQLEHENPDLGEIDVSDLGLGDCMAISVPGNGSTREEACRNAVAKFKTGTAALSLRAEHDAWREEVTA